MKERLVSIITQNSALQLAVKDFLQRYSLDSKDLDRISIVSSASSSGSSTLESPEDVYFSCRTFSILSDDSFLSALEDIVPPVQDLAIEIREPVKLNASDLCLYYAAMKAVSFGLVGCRIIRSEAMNCHSDEEFLAKVFCIRSASNDPTMFQHMYDRLLDYVQDPENWRGIENELKGRKVQELNFYDVLMDFVLMDAFDDLAHPPASVLAVAQNRFLTASFKESVRDGFLSHYYDVCEQVSPTFAWGFLGTDERLRQLFYYFKSQVYNFLLDIFNFEKVRYTTAKDLAEDIWNNFKYRVEMTHSKLMDNDIVVE
ncbi:unnamed protein product [Soboliphyme baturini]|uniref:Protein FAM73B n=1 Tax=Soboliphyme baturini TaxID=241478 RepID=A0A183II89_9BILA|nr:unnamed protein product [Soboliphyme baturini]